MEHWAKIGRDTGNYGIGNLKTSSATWWCQIFPPKKLFPRYRKLWDWQLEKI